MLYWIWGQSKPKIHTGFDRIITELGPFVRFEQEKLVPEDLLEGGEPWNGHREEHLPIAPVEPVTELHSVKIQDYQAEDGWPEEKCLWRRQSYHHWHRCC